MDDKGYVINNLLDTANILQDEGELYPEETAYGDGSNTLTEDEYRMEQNPPDRLDEDDIDSEAYDKLLGAEVMVDFGMEGRKRATVKSRARDYDGNLIGRHHRNPQLDQREYVIKYDDGTSDQMFGNIIAANLYAEMDETGITHTMLRDIVDHRRTNDAISKDDGYFVLKYGAKVPKQTTKGWDICVEWRNGETSWIPLKDIKVTNPVEVAEYAIANKIQDEPAFAWWVPVVI